MPTFRRPLRWFGRLPWWWKPPVLLAFFFICLLLTAVAWRFLALTTYRKLQWAFLTPTERILSQADQLSEAGNWRAASPLYQTVEEKYRQQGNAAMALYAHASQIPAASEFSTQSLEYWIRQIDEELSLREAQNPKTKLRLLQIKGQLENNYDATLAYRTWQQVEQLAGEQHRWIIRNRAYGEEAIGLFLLGNSASARIHAIRSYAQTSQWFLQDRAGRLRMASLIGSGMVAFQAYTNALPYLDEAIAIANAIPNAAYPNVAVSAKIDALRGLKHYQQALALCAEAIRVPEREHLKGHLYQILTTRAGVLEDIGDLAGAIRDYAQAFGYARELGYWRGLTETGGLLARNYEGENDLQRALSIINEALNAQQKIPSEMYFAPRNLAVKADILKRLGRIADSNTLYERSLALVDSLLITAPTPNVEHRILDEYASVYSGYFASLCEQQNLPAAFKIIERAYGRVEQIALQDQKHVSPHAATPEEQKLTSLNLQLIDTEDESRRQTILSNITVTEDQLEYDPWSHAVATHPVSLSTLQGELRPNELLIEYVMATPVSYALAITRESITPYALASRNTIRDLAGQYITVLSQQRTDKVLAQNLFQRLLGPIREYATHTSVIIVPNDNLHLLPFAALNDGKEYVIATHETSVVAAGTVLHMLRSRSVTQLQGKQPFVGFAPWATAEDQLKPNRFATLLASWRGGTGPKRSEFAPLPESKREVVTARDEVDKLEGEPPRRDQLKIGREATEAEFKRLPLADYRVLHMAVHGYADIEHPDRSALVFAQSAKEESEDGLLQIREIRGLRLNSSLVILSACRTALGPADEGGVVNIANAFQQAGAQTVVSSFWPVSDHASSDFMELFYTNLGKGETKSQALRHAATSSLQAGLPPYNWAAFEISGDASEPLVIRNQ